MDMSSSDQEISSLGERLQLSLRSELLKQPDVDLEQYVAVFHDWIRQAAIGGGLLIDVASYAHVPNGPGVLLIGHEFDYGVRIALGRLELTCRHKRDPGGEGNALKRCLRQLLQAAELLQNESKLSEPPTFHTAGFEFRSNDRLRCPNNAETGSRVTQILGQLFSKVLGAGDLDLASIGMAREPLTLVIQRVDAAEPIAGALRRLQQSA
jgi:hypothetical protein